MPPAGLIIIIFINCNWAVTLWQWLFLSEYKKKKKTSIFSTDFRKNSQTLNCTKIRSAVAELFPADGHTNDRTHEEANSRFTRFWERALKVPRSIPLISFTYNSTGYPTCDSRHVVPCCCPIHVPTMHLHTQWAHNGMGVVQWRTEGRLGGSTSPHENRKALQNRAKLNPIVKTVKNC